MLFQYLAGLAVIQIPELDMSVSHSYKVGAVLGERHTRHLTGYLVGCYNNIFLQENKINYKCKNYSHGKRSWLWAKTPEGQVPSTPRRWPTCHVGFPRWQCICCWGRKPHMRRHICAAGAPPPVFALPRSTVSPLVGDRSGEKGRRDVEEEKVRVNSWLSLKKGLIFWYLFFKSTGAGYKQ